MHEDFEEWFAIRNDHSDDDIWPGRLRFSTTKGISLESINFPNSRNPYDAPNCDTGTITGYLDYQRPTTLIKPWVQSRGGGSMGVDTPLVRSKSNIVASGILKNIHLIDLSEKCFTALFMDMPAFSAWYAPDLVKRDYKFDDETGPPSVSVDVEAPSIEEFLLNDGTNVMIHSFAGTSEEENTTKVIQRTSLTFELSEAIDLVAAQQRIWRATTLFSFFLGHQMAQNPYRLKTTHTRKWNDKDQNVTAELLFRPVFESETRHVAWHDALFRRDNCVLSSQSLLNFALSQTDALFYLMNTVLKMERSKRLSANDFSEFLGCIEDFDIKTFGSGSSKPRKSSRKALRKVVKEHGTSDDLLTLDGMASDTPNRFTLVQRLNRLQQAWEDANFRGKPDPVEIVRIRNDISHGRGVDLSSEDYQKLVWFIEYLCALSRFHIFITLGLTAKDIGSAFSRFGFTYSKFAPEKAGGP